MTDLNKRLAGLSPEKRALLMQQLSKQTVATAKKEIGRRARPARIPLSFSQQRLWFMDQFDPDSAVYNVPSAMWLHGRPDIAVLERALGEIVRRHEVLRTVMGSDEQGPFQTVLAAAPVPIARHDLRHLPAGERRDAAGAVARTESATPFSIARGPLLRAALITIGEDEHLFVLNAHHIAVDGWSYSVIYTEFCKLYDAFISGQPSPLDELPIQYVDYTLWQQELLAEDGDTLKKQLAYWQERLAGTPPVLELPSDRVRPAQQSYRGALVRHRVDGGLFDAMKRLARDEGATVFMVFAAALQTLLARYSGQQDVIVGVGVANRRREELEALVGFFVNTLALRTDLSGNPSFRDLLARVKEGTLGAYSHQDLPIERLLEVLNLERSMGHSPLFQVMLFFQNFPSQETRLHGLTLSGVEPGVIGSGTARTDLAVFAGEDEYGLAMNFEYATDLFDAATIDAFAGHLIQLLHSVVADPSRCLSQVDILPAAERRLLLRDWNDTARDTGHQRSVHALFEAQVARTPDAVAISHHGQKISYRELDQRANALAHALAARGVATGDLVGLFVKRSAEMMVALLGILKAGAAYIPLDPAYPADRIAFMLEDSNASLVVSQRALAALLPAHKAAPLLLDDVPFNDQPLMRQAGPESTAYVIYTSGSTGRPKGVLLPHRAVVNFLASMAQEPGMTSADTICAVTTLSFDIAVLELVLPLTVGARVEIADGATAADGAALARLTDTSGATIMQATPASWRMLLDAGWNGQPGLKALCGGEALGRELADRLLACTAEVWNMYGPTETTIWSSVERVAPGTDAILIGKPIANTRFYVVDASMQAVPAGVHGELLIGGLGVASGYHARADLTSEKFIADPHSSDPGARLYRTGDLARWTRSGKVEVLGRIDNQVKLRGFRIELGEIESVLADHPGVRQAVVICREDRPGDKRLAAYLVAEPDAQVDAAALRSFCMTRLPEYMLPSAYMTLAQLPMTPNGKIDRRALPVPDAGAAPAAAYVGPRDEQEETLCALWAQALGLEQVGIHDDFFKLGGHSLLATQLVMRIQKAFGGEVALRSLFEAPTVAAFAELMMRERLENVDASDLAGMLDQLEGLSDENIEALLSGALEMP
jgi:amino acid adenylation domain-containing protein